MCGLCGLIGEQQDWTDSLRSDLPRRQERLRKIKMLNHITASYRLSITDFQGVNYLIQTPTGKQSIANGLDQLWNEIQQLTGQKIDVLDPRLLSHLEAL